MTQITLPKTEANADKAVQVWRIPLEVSDDTLNRYLACLSEDEMNRANRFRFADDRRRFAVARGTLRHLLGQQFEQPPSDIEFCYGEYGKPEMGKQTSQIASHKKSHRKNQPASCDFHFNLSHSGEIALCALGHNRQVGIDIEKLKPMKRLESMMERCFVGSEQSHIQRADNPSHTFLQYWTCKEAYLKAIGLGLIQSMQTVEVQLAPPQFMTVPHDCAEGWHLELLPLPQDYLGALVIAGETKVQTSSWKHP
ncbi:MAG: 4'-phosphopantetheinyl transferase superfamily protein [Cyanobacteria bacterium P01_F01_bin.53]